MRRWLLPVLLALAPGRTGAAPAPVQPPAGLEARLTDAEAEALAKAAMASNNPAQQADTLKRLETHHFRTSLAKERELTLFVQGLLEDRLGKTPLATVTFHKLELAWPNSPYLAEGQVIMADSAAQHKRYQEAESRLHKALQADIPVESQRRAQELLLWILAEQGRTSEGAVIVTSLKPLGSARPSEKGLVGILEAQCAAREKPQAQLTVRDYHNLFPNGPRLHRVDLDWAKLQGSMGDPRGAAKGFQRIIQESPTVPEADEARLALATLLTDGTLQPKETEDYPAAQTLLADLNKAELKDGPARQALLVRLRLAIRDKAWQEALGIVTAYRALHPTPPEALVLDSLRTEVIRKWAQTLLDRHQPTPLLPFLDPEGIRCLTPPQRLALTQQLTAGGLPEATEPIARLAPPAERAALVKAAQEGTASGANPVAALALLPAKGETAQESLMRAQANLALHQWPEARAALAKARPGPERIQALLIYLNRPVETGETPQGRLKEVEAWLVRAPEKGTEREPLAILAADLKAQGGDWRGALALYPPPPQAGNRGWVFLMRATCQARLGQTVPAKATLKQAGDDPAFKNERQALQQRLGD